MPTVGAAVGTAIAPGVGTAIGGALGNVASQSLRSRAKKTANRRRAPAPRRKRVRNRRASYRKRRTRKGNLPGSSPAIKQLFQLIQNPRFMQALTSLNLGEQGRKAIAVGSLESLSSVPTGAFLNLLESLANEAAMEAAQNESVIPSYLEAADGEALCDLASPDERARVLMERLQEDDLYLETDLYEDDESDDEVFSWLEEAGLIEDPVF